VVQDEDLRRHGCSATGLPAGGGVDLEAGVLECGWEPEEAAAAHLEDHEQEDDHGGHDEAEDEVTGHGYLLVMGRSALQIRGEVGEDGPMAALATDVRLARAPVSAPTFQVQVLAATAIPWLIVAAFGTSDWLLTAMVAVFGAHVPVTAGLYMDPEATPILRADPLRYFLAPVAVVAVIAAVVFTGPQWMLANLPLAITLWTIHHFTKQTYGVLSLVCAARKVPRISTLERRIVTLTGYSAMLVVLGNAVDAQYRDDMRLLGGLMLAACAAFVVGEQLRSPGDAGRFAAMLAAVAFYLPLFVISDPLVAATTYGSAHGAQYLIIVRNLGQDRTTDAVRRFRWWTVGAFIVGGVAFRLIADAGEHRLAVVAVNGVLAWHFIADAGLWRMSRPLQREYVGRRFAFLR
jgi:hypothetical protein